MLDIREHLTLSRRVELDDLDWAQAAREGLSDDDRRILTYFADVEGQTPYYMLEVAKLDVARDPELLTFLTMWNYEELFHSHAIIRLLAVCGAPPPVDRSHALRTNAQLRARLEDAFQTTLAKVVPQAFVALWMTWGATQELLTACAYDQLARSLGNSVGREVARRIAKQERRHFAYYHASARARLEGNWFAQRMIRTLCERLWAPVGQGVKTPGEIEQMCCDLFPGAMLGEVFGHIDQRIGALPGMRGLCAARPYAAKIYARRGIDPTTLPPAAMARGAIAQA